MPPKAAASRRTARSPVGGQQPAVSFEIVESPGDPAHVTTVVPIERPELLRREALLGAEVAASAGCGRIREVAGRRHVGVGGADAADRVSVLVEQRGSVGLEADPLRRRRRDARSRPRVEPGERRLEQMVHREFSDLVDAEQRRGTGPQERVVELDGDRREPASDAGIGVRASGYLVDPVSIVRQIAVGATSVRLLGPRVQRDRRDIARLHLLARVAGGDGRHGRVDPWIATGLPDEVAIEDRRAVGHAGCRVEAVADVEQQQRASARPSHRVEMPDVVTVERVGGDRGLEQLPDLADHVPVEALLGKLKRSVSDRIERLHDLDRGEPSARTTSRDRDVGVPFEQVFRGLIPHDVDTKLGMGRLHVDVAAESLGISRPAHEDSGDIRHPGRLDLHRSARTVAIDVRLARDDELFLDVVERCEIDRTRGALDGRGRPRHAFARRRWLHGCGQRVCGYWLRGTRCRRNDHTRSEHEQADQACSRSTRSCPHGPPLVLHIRTVSIVLAERWTTE